MTFFQDFNEQFDAQILFGQMSDPPSAGLIATAKVSPANGLDFFETLLQAMWADLGINVTGRDDMMLPAGPARRLKTYWPAVDNKPAFEMSMIVIQTPDIVYILGLIAYAPQFEALVPMLDDVAMTFTVAPVATATPFTSNIIPEGWKTVQGDGFSLAMPKSWLSMPGNLGLLNATVSEFKLGSEAQKIIGEFSQIVDVKMLFGQIIDGSLAGAASSFKSHNSLDFFEALFRAMWDSIEGEITKISREDLILPAGPARRLNTY